MDMCLRDDHLRSAIDAVRSEHAHLLYRSLHASEECTLYGIWAAKILSSYTEKRRRRGIYCFTTNNKTRTMERKNSRQRIFQCLTFIALFNEGYCFQIDFSYEHSVHHFRVVFTICCCLKIVFEYLVKIRQMDFFSVLVLQEVTQIDLW